jgi:hypothetical protein
MGKTNIFSATEYTEGKITRKVESKVIGRCDIWGSGGRKLREISTAVGTVRMGSCLGVGR